VGYIAITFLCLLDERKWSEWVAQERKAPPRTNRILLIKMRVSERFGVPTLDFRMKALMELEFPTHF